MSGKRFSLWKKLVRHFARIKVLVRRRKSKESAPLILNSDLKHLARVIISLIQSEAFSVEVKHIRNNSPVPINSKLQQLNPIISEIVLKVNGRLKHSNLPTELKHPIVLPSDHHITEIIIRDIHENSLHSGRDHNLAISKEHYWIINAKSVIKRVLSQCIPCKFENMKPSNQLMGQLPNERTAVFDPVFTNTGVDYFGPVLVKNSKRIRFTSGYNKHYGVVLTCLTTRATHLELAGDLSTDLIIPALKRFIARGQPKVMYSDNGSNFRGAEKEIYFQKLTLIKLVKPLQIITLIGNLYHP